MGGKIDGFLDCSKLECVALPLLLMTEQLRRTATLQSHISGRTDNY